MDEFNSARLVAQKLNDVFHTIYKNVHSGSFDSAIDFSEIPSSVLKDFLLYTAGFMGVNNNDEIDETLTIAEMSKMLAGKFTIKYLTNDQLEAIAKKNGIKIQDTDKPQTIKLYSIQDGTYYLNKNVFDPTKKVKTNFISLVTSPVEIQTNSPDLYRRPKSVLIHLRDTFAHESPHVIDNLISFSNFAHPEDVIVVSKMWLRGYTEMFARKSMPFSPDEMAEFLQTALRGTTNTLSSFSDIDIALDSIKGIFTQEQQDEFSKFKSLVKTRIGADRNFQHKDLNSKINTLVGIAYNNPSYFNDKNGVCSAQILYTLENLVGIELEKRNETAPLDEQDPDVEEFVKIIEEISSLQKGLKTISSLKSMKHKSSKTHKKYRDMIQYLTEQANEKVQVINPKRKLESAHMDLLAFENLENLPIEVAVNTIYLLAFNNLVSSRFYEQTLRYSDFHDLNATQKAFFDSFDFDKINFEETKNNRFHCCEFYTAEDKAFLLYSMRNALCHGNLTYSIPEAKRGIKLTYKSTILTFNAEQQGVIISGRLKDFYRLFSSPQFTQERNEELITTYDRKRIKAATTRRKRLNAQDNKNAEPNQN